MFATGGRIPAWNEHGDDRIPAVLSEGGCYSHDPFTGRPSPAPYPQQTWERLSAIGLPTYLLAPDTQHEDGTQGSE